MQQTWRAVFQEHYPAVVRHVTYLIGDPAAAEDVAQETFLRLMRQTFRDPAAAGPWLRLVATRLAYNFLRGEGRRRAREEKVERDRWLLQGPPEKGDASEALRAALERLPVRDRMALLLRAGGSRYGEIAAAIGVRESSVGTLLARATRRLREAYERELRDEADPLGRGAALPWRT